MITSYTSCSSVLTFGDVHSWEANNRVISSPFEQLHANAELQDEVNNNTEAVVSIIRRISNTTTNFPLQRT